MVSSGEEVGDKGQRASIGVGLYVPAVTQGGFCRGSYYKDFPCRGCRGII